MNEVFKSAVPPAALIWLATALAASLAGGVSGLPEVAAAAIFAGAALPAVSTIIVALKGKRWPVGRKVALAVLPWIALSVIAVSLTGGIASPALLTAGLAPLFALAFGWRTRALEAAFFSLVALAASIAAAAFLETSIMDPAIGPPSGLLAIGALATGAVLLAASLKSPVSRGARNRRGTDARVNASARAEARPNPGPVMIVDVAGDGRVRMVSGELAVSLAPQHKQPFTDAFPEEHEDCLRDALSADGTALTLDIGETPLELIFDPHAAGTRVFITEASQEDSPQTEAAETIASDAERRAQAAEVALEERTAFFASLGHELKTPLNAILGFSDLMRNELRGELPQAYKEYVQLIHESGQDLLLTVEDILDYAKAEAGSTRLELEPVDLVASSESVIAQLSGFAERAGVNIRQRATGEVWATGDARAVRQIWQNLLSNAIKYSSPGSTVSIDARSGTSTVALSVRDTGTGMTASDLELVARPFQQGSNARGRAGTGLGLAVVKSFADLMTGKVIIDTAPGEGTRVRVILPKAVEEDTADPESKADEAVG